MSFDDFKNSKRSQNIEKLVTSLFWII